MLRLMRFVSQILALSSAALFVAGCALPLPAATEYMSSAVTAEAPRVPVPGQITVDGAAARPAPLEGGNGAAFLTVLNGADQPVRLTSAASTVAAHVELHETMNEGGVMKMVPQPGGFEIPAGGSVQLAPGGKHVMLIGLVQPLAEGDSFPLTLNFDNGESITITVPVVAMTAMPGMPAMGSEGGEGEMPGMNEMTGTHEMSGSGEMGGAGEMGGMDGMEQPAETPTTQP